MPTAITLAGNGFTDGQTVVYQSLTSADIGSLADGFQYTVHKLSANVFQFLDPSNNNAVTALTVPTGATLHELDYFSQVFSFKPATAVDPTQDTIALPSHGLLTGQAVIYQTGSNERRRRRPRRSRTRNGTVGPSDWLSDIERCRR